MRPQRSSAQRTARVDGPAAPSYGRLAAVAWVHTTLFALLLVLYGLSFLVPEEFHEGILDLVGAPASRGTSIPAFLLRVALPLLFVVTGFLAAGRLFSAFPRGCGVAWPRRLLAALAVLIPFVGLLYVRALQKRRA